MKLTHTGDYGLTGLLVGLYAECGILLSELLEADTEFVEVFLSLGLYGDADNGFGELHSLKYDRMVFVTEGVAGTDVLETYTCAYIAATDHLLGVLLVGVHLEETAYTLLLAGAAVEHV